jgi:putative flippase GtrA
MDNFTQENEKIVCQASQNEQPQDLQTAGVKQTKQQLFWEIFRFLLVGGLATVADYIVFYLFRQWGFPAGLVGDTLSLVIATALGFVVGLIVNWVLSVGFVYRQVKDEKQARSKKSFVIFTIIGVIGLGITELGVWLLVQKIIPEFEFFGVTEFLLPWNEWVAKVVMTCIVLVFNYVGRKLFVFKS